jgi:hypothetical protein
VGGDQLSDRENQTMQTQPLCSENALTLKQLKRDGTSSSQAVSDSCNGLESLLV